MILEPLLRCAAPVTTLLGDQPLTNASGFFFQRDDRLFLITSRHVVWDEASGHLPDRLEITLHTDPDNLAAATGFSIPLYQERKAVWRQGEDASGGIDVCAIEIERSALPDTGTWCSFTPDHLQPPSEPVEVGTALLIVGFPLGFSDTLHHTPVVRHAILASSFGLRFKGEGYFLTDARTHRGSSGAPVVMRAGKHAAALGELQWMLLGVHSARLDLAGRDVSQDEALGLNCAWYADILMTLTRD